MIPTGGATRPASLRHADPGDCHSCLRQAGRDANPPTGQAPVQGRFSAIGERQKTGDQGIGAIARLGPGARDGPAAARAEEVLASVDVEIDLEAQTQVFESRGGPLHDRCPRGW